MYCVHQPGGAGADFIECYYSVILGFSRHHRHYIIIIIIIVIIDIIIVIFITLDIIDIL